jgi:hypothetical protein
MTSTGPEEQLQGSQKVHQQVTDEVIYWEPPCELYIWALKV